MKTLKTVFSLLMIVGIAIYLVVTPNIILKNVGKSDIFIWQRKSETFSGIINVWHIVGFKAHSGSVSTWVSARAKEFEKKHYNIFVTVSAMDADEYNERIARGERADVYSFPMGLEYSDFYKPLDGTKIENTLPYIKSALRNTGKDEGVFYALPYMYSGYCLISNNDALLKNKISIDDNISIERINEIAGSTENALCGNRVYGAMCGIDKPMGEYEVFKAKKALLAIADFRAVGDIQRQLDAGRGFVYSAYSLNGYTDQVQYVALDANIDEKKIPYAYEIMETFFSDKAQEELKKMNAYPATEYDKTEKMLDGYTSIAYDAFAIYCEPKVANCFLYKRYSDALNEDALQTLNGDSEAKKRFDGRMKELLYISH